MDKEIWKSVVGYEGLYEISSMGRVKRLSRTIIDSIGRKKPYDEKILVNKISGQTGYPCVNLTKDGKVRTLNIHRLIADAFIPNPDNLPCINHKDEDRSNSVLSNLERCTYKYNSTYGNAISKRLNTLRKGLEGKHRPIFQFTKNGVLVEKHLCGVNQLEEKLGYCISTCLAGNSKTAHGFIFSYDEKFAYKEDLPKKHQKYVIQVDESGNEIRRFKSKLEVEHVYRFSRHRLSSEGPCKINGMNFIVEKK